MHDAGSRRRTYLRQGCTVIYVAVDGALAGYLALSDTLRQESAATIDGAVRSWAFSPCC